MSDRFTELYRQHGAAVYGYLAYRLGSRAEAERLTEMTFERALAALGSSPTTTSPDRVWLLTIARRAARGRRPDGVDDGDLGVTRELARALARLEPGHRSVIALHFGAGLEGSEIAGVLDLSPARVRDLLSRGLRRLRTELEREDEGAGAGLEARSAAEGGRDRPDQEQDQP